MDITYHYFTSDYLGSSVVACRCCYTDCLDCGVCRGPSNIALCCPACGQIWGRIVADGQRRWIFENRFCLKCPATNVVGVPIPSGTFSTPYAGGMIHLARWGWGMALENLPMEVLLHDFQRAMLFLDSGALNVRS